MYPKTFLSEWDPMAYSKGELTKGLPESAVQAAILGYLALRRVVAFPVDVGAKQLQGRAFGALRRAGVSTAALKGRTGAGMKGVSDIIGVIPDSGRALFIEVKAPAWYAPSKKTGAMVLKRPHGEPSKEQLGFLDTMHRAGALVGVAWSVSDAEYILSEGKCP